MATIDRAPDELRMVRILPDYTEMAAGSVLICCGRTRVICTASVQEGVPSFLRGRGKGWLTADRPVPACRLRPDPPGRAHGIHRL